TQSVNIEVIPGERMFHVTNPPPGFDPRLVTAMTDTDFDTALGTRSFQVPIGSGASKNLIIYAYDQYKNPLAAGTPVTWTLDGSGRLGSHHGTESVPQSDGGGSDGDNLVDPTHVQTEVENDQGLLTMVFTQERYPHCPWDLEVQVDPAKIQLITYGQQNS